jgi:hypothetical protein
MGSSGEHGIDVEVRADRAVPATATVRAVELIRRLARSSGRQIQYAAVELGVDDQWRGRRSRQVEIVIDMVGIYVRGFAAGATFTEALDELDRNLERRVGYAQDRVRSRTGLRPAPLRSLLVGPPTSRSTGRSLPGKETPKHYPRGSAADTRSSSAIGQMTSVSGPAGSSGPVR